MIVCGAEWISYIWRNITSAALTDSLLTKRYRNIFNSARTTIVALIDEILTDIVLRGIIVVPIQQCTNHQCRMDWCIIDWCCTQRYDTIKITCLASLNKYLHIFEIRVIILLPVLGWGDSRVDDEYFSVKLTTFTCYTKKYSCVLRNEIKKTLTPPSPTLFAVNRLCKGYI